ncbi:hypothetical protein TFLX_02883 [Thermoflexales bacterium]|nr:hypothetical protein TFLX_02883 [Thermoflexales bacterium]
MTTKSRKILSVLILLGFIGTGVLSEYNLSMRIIAPLFGMLIGIDALTSPETSVLYLLNKRWYSSDMFELGMIFSIIFFFAMFVLGLFSLIPP